MAKKRSDTKKKNNSSSGANATTTGGSSNDNNGGVDNNASSSSKKLIANDNNHSTSIPCSNLALEIAHEIFPIAVAGTTATTLSGTRESVENNVVEITDTDNDNDLILELEESSSKPQPLLGCMIQNYLIDERKRLREEQQQGIIIATNATATTTTTTGGSSSTSTTTTTKKKKNKKKKKKKSSSANHNNNNNAATTGAAEVVGEEEVVGSSEDPITVGVERGEKNNGCSILTKKLSTSNTCSSLELNLANPITSPTNHSHSNAVEIIMKGDNNNNNNNNKQAIYQQDDASIQSSGLLLDHLLDSIIDSSKETSSDMMIMVNNKEATNKRYYGQRDLQSFAAFLSRKLEEKNQLKQQQQHQRHLSNKKDKSSTITSTTSTTTSSSLSMNNHNNSGIEYKDILPTISTNLALAYTKSIDCRTCRTSANSHLRCSLTKKEESTNNNNNSGNWNGSANSNSNEGTEIIGLENFLQQQQQQQDVVIVLNETSAITNKGSSSNHHHHYHGGGSTSIFGGNDHRMNKKKSTTTTTSWSIPISSMFTNEYDVNDAFDYMNMDDIVDLEAGQGDYDDDPFLIGGPELDKLLERDAKLTKLASPMLTKLLGPNPNDLLEEKCAVDVDGGITAAAAAAAATAGTSSTQFQLALRSISKASENERYLQIRAEGRSDGSGSGSGCHYPMSTQDIINLVKYIIVPCGLVAEKGGNYSSSEGAAFHSEQHQLSDKEMEDIVNDAFGGIMANHQAGVQNAKAIMYHIKEKMAEAVNANNRSVFDSKTSKLLQDTDGLCEIFLKKMGDLMTQLFQSACFVGWSEAHGMSMLGFVLTLWEKYFNALNQLVKPVLKHRGYLLRAGLREGTVPQAYTNKIARNSLFEMVEAKIATLDSFVEDFKATLDGRRDQPNPLVRLCVLEAYRKHKEPWTTPSKILDHEEVFVSITKLIVAQIELAQNNVGGGVVDVVIGKAHDQREKVVTLCQQIRKFIIVMEDVVPESKAQELHGVFEDLESRWYDVDKNAKDHASNSPSTVRLEGDKEYLAKDTMLLLQKASILISQWFVLLTSRQCNETSLKSLTLPRTLETWVDNVNGTESPPAPRNRDAKQKCEEGLGGERRVASILGSLLYRWLEARCSEWHAELTRDELLLSMDMEEPLVAREQGGSNNKGGKKKKKSKRKSGGVNKGKNEDEKINLQTVEKATSSGDVTTTVMDEGSASNTSPVEKKSCDFELSQDEKKDDSTVCETDVDDETMKLVQSLIAADEIEMGIHDTVAADEGEWQEKKSKRNNTGGGTKGQTQEKKAGSLRNSVKESSKKNMPKDKETKAATTNEQSSSNKAKTKGAATPQAEKKVAVPKTEKREAEKISAEKIMVEKTESKKTSAEKIVVDKTETKKSDNEKTAVETKAAAAKAEKKEVEEKEVEETGVEKAATEKKEIKKHESKKKKNGDKNDGKADKEKKAVQNSVGKTERKEAKQKSNATNEANEKTEKTSSRSAKNNASESESVEEQVVEPLQEDLVDTECEYQPSVGVIDGKEVVEAEAYLVRRIQVVAKLKGYDSTPNGKRVPIVWL